MTTASPMTSRASGPSLLIIEKQQGQWDQQQTALMYNMTIKQCLHELSRPPPRWLTRWSTDIKYYYSGTWRWVKPLIWAGGPPMGLYRTAVVQGLSSPCAESQVVVHVSRKRTLYDTPEFPECSLWASQKLPGTSKIRQTGIDEPPSSGVDPSKKFDPQNSADLSKKIAP